MPNERATLFSQIFAVLTQQRTFNPFSVAFSGAARLFFGDDGGWGGGGGGGYYVRDKKIQVTHERNITSEE